MATQDPDFTSVLTASPRGKKEGDLLAARLGKFFELPPEDESSRAPFKATEETVLIMPPR